MSLQPSVSPAAEPLTRPVTLPRVVRPGRLSPVMRVLTTARDRRHPVARFLARRLRSNWGRLEALPGPVRRLLTRPSSLILSVDGIDRELVFDAANGHFRYYYLPDVPGLYETELTLLLPLLVGQDGVLFDIGSNWGFHGLALALRPDFAGTVHAFEANPEIFRELDDAVRQLGLADRVYRHKIGLSDAPGRAFMTRISRSGDTGDTRIADKGDIAIDLATLDSLDLPAPTVMKLDVEGHEEAVLNGAVATIAATRPYIVVESQPPDGTATDADFPALARLEALGYQLYFMVWITPDGRRIDYFADLGDADRVDFVLEPTTIARRAARRHLLNILGVPRERLDDLRARFTASDTPPP